MNDAGASRSAGCLSMLGGPLLALGLWLIAQAVLLPREAETVRLSIITGAFVAGTGAWLLAKRLRTAFPRRAKEPRWNETVIDDTAPASRPTGAVGPDGKPARGDPSPMEALAGGLGCSIVVLAFLLVGPVFLYFYFSGTPTRRGNPVMALVAGILFSGIGLFGLWALVSSRSSNASRQKSKDPRRLP
jgi:ABC-type nickel/cobalt efflux system permease component RcnA